MANKPPYSPEDLERMRADLLGSPPSKKPVQRNSERSTGIQPSSFDRNNLDQLKRLGEPLGYRGALKPTDFEGVPAAKNPIRAALDPDMSALKGPYKNTHDSPGKLGDAKVRAERSAARRASLEKVNEFNPAKKAGPAVLGPIAEALAEPIGGAIEGMQRMQASGERRNPNHLNPSPDRGFAQELASENTAKAPIAGIPGAQALGQHQLGGAGDYNHGDFRRLVAEAAAGRNYRRGGATQEEFEEAKAKYGDAPGEPKFRHHFVAEFTDIPSLVANFATGPILSGAANPWSYDDMGTLGRAVGGGVAGHVMGKLLSPVPKLLSHIPTVREGVNKAAGKLGSTTVGEGADIASGRIADMVNRAVGQRAVTPEQVKLGGMGVAATASQVALPRAWDLLVSGPPDDAYGIPKDQINPDLAALLSPVAAMAAARKLLSERGAKEVVELISHIRGKITKVGFEQEGQYRNALATLETALAETRDPSRTVPLDYKQLADHSAHTGLIRQSPKEPDARQFQLEPIIKAMEESHPMTGVQFGMFKHPMEDAVNILRHFQQGELSAGQAIEMARHTSPETHRQVEAVLNGRADEVIPVPKEPGLGGFLQGRLPEGTDAEEPGVMDVSRRMVEGPYDRLKDVRHKLHQVATGRFDEDVDRSSQESIARDLLGASNPANDTDWGALSHDIHKLQYGDISREDFLAKYTRESADDLDQPKPWSPESEGEGGLISDNRPDVPRWKLEQTVDEFLDAVGADKARRSEADALVSRWTEHREKVWDKKHPEERRKREQELAAIDWPDIMPDGMRSAAVRGDGGWLHLRDLGNKLADRMVETGKKLSDVIGEFSTRDQSDIARLLRNAGLLSAAGVATLATIDDEELDGLDDASLGGALGAAAALRQMITGSPRFYSKLYKDIERVAQNTATGKQWLGMLRGKTRKIELDRIEDMLLAAADVQVSKQDLLEAVKTNGIQLRETVRGDRIFPLQNPVIQNLNDEQVIVLRNGLKAWNDVVREDGSASTSELAAILANDSDFQKAFPVATSGDDYGAYTRALVQRAEYLAAHILYPAEEAEKWYAYGRTREALSELLEQAGYSWRDALRVSAEIDAALTNAAHADDAQASISRDLALWAVPDHLRPAIEETSEKLFNLHQSGVPKNWHKNKGARYRRHAQADEDEVGENYREILVQLPSGGDYSSPHWQEGDVLGHLRVSEYTTTGPGGKEERVLKVHELQSDWAQDGREQGWRDEKARRKREENLNRLRAIKQKALEEWLHAIESGADNAMELEAKWFQAKDAYHAAIHSRVGDGPIADMPFKKTDDWLGLLWKTLIDEAVAGDFDRIAWTTADEQFGLYGSELFEWRKDHRGGWGLKGKLYHGGIVEDIANQQNRQFSEKVRVGEDPTTGEPELSDIQNLLERVLAEEVDDEDLLAQKANRLSDVLAKKMVENPNGEHMPRYEGMKKFYGEIVPNWVKQYADKLGVKIQIGETVLNKHPKPSPSFRIPEKLREIVKTEGQALGIAGAGAALSQQEPEDSLDRGSIIGPIGGLVALGKYGTFGGKIAKELAEQVVGMAPKAAYRWLAKQDAELGRHLARVEDTYKKTFTPRVMKRLRALYEDGKRQGTGWYEAGREALERHFPDPEQRKVFRDLVAHFSQMQKVGKDLEDALIVSAAVKLGIDPGQLSVGGVAGPRAEKLIGQVLQGRGVDGPSTRKILEFAGALGNTEKSSNVHHAVLDRHMEAAVKKLTGKPYGLGNEVRYDAYERAVAQIANEVGARPEDVQASIWFAVRDPETVEFADGLFGDSGPSDTYAHYLDQVGWIENTIMHGLNRPPTATKPNVQLEPEQLGLKLGAAGALAGGGQDQDQASLAGILTGAAVRTPQQLRLLLGKATRGLFKTTLAASDPSSMVKDLVMLPPERMAALWRELGITMARHTQNPEAFMRGHTGVAPTSELLTQIMLRLPQAELKRAVKKAFKSASKSDAPKIIPLMFGSTDELHDFTPKTRGVAQGFFARDQQGNQYIAKGYGKSGHTMANPVAEHNSMELLRRYFGSPTFESRLVTGPEAAHLAGRAGMPEAGRTPVSGNEHALVIRPVVDYMQTVSDVRAGRLPDADMDADEVAQGVREGVVQAILNNPDVHGSNQVFLDNGDLLTLDTGAALRGSTWYPLAHHYSGTLLNSLFKDQQPKGVNLERVLRPLATRLKGLSQAERADLQALVEEGVHSWTPVLGTDDSFARESAANTIRKIDRIDDVIDSLVKAHEWAKNTKDAGERALILDDARKALRQIAPVITAMGVGGWLDSKNEELETLGNAGDMLPIALAVGAGALAIGAGMKWKDLARAARKIVMTASGRAPMLDEAIERMATVGPGEDLVEQVFALMRTNRVPMHEVLGGPPRNRGIAPPQEASATFTELGRPELEGGLPASELPLSARILYATEELPDVGEANHRYNAALYMLDELNARGAMPDELYEPAKREWAMWHNRQLLRNSYMQSVTKGRSSADLLATIEAAEQAMKDRRITKRDFVTVLSAAELQMSKAQPPAEPIQREVARATEAPTNDRSPNETVRAHAAGYVQQTGIEPATLGKVSKVDEEFATRIAKFYDAAQSHPEDHQVIEGYRTFADEVRAQYEYLVSQGVQFEFVEGDPYKNSAEMMHDVRENNRLRVFKTPEGHHPLLTPEENDMFRAVHDYFGHAKEGNQFGPVGEENAYREHSAMFGPLARRAMATETRAQNSWVNYGPHGEANRANPAATRYSEQKVLLMPEHLMGEAIPASEHLDELDRRALNNQPGFGSVELLSKMAKLGGAGLAATYAYGAEEDDPYRGLAMLGAGMLTANAFGGFKTLAKGGEGAQKLLDASLSAIRGATKANQTMRYLFNGYGLPQAVQSAIAQAKRQLASLESETLDALRSSQDMLDDQGKTRLAELMNGHIAARGNLAMLSGTPIYQRYVELLKAVNESGAVKGAHARHMDIHKLHSKVVMGELLATIAADPTLYQKGPTAKQLQQVARAEVKARIKAGAIAMAPEDWAREVERLVNGKRAQESRRLRAEGFVRLPRTLAGNSSLRGTWVRRDIKEELERIAAIPDRIAQYGQTMQRLHTLWKRFHSVDNPATHVTNVISNMVVGEASGALPLLHDPRAWGSMGAAGRELAEWLRTGKQSPDIAEALKHGMLAGDIQGIQEFTRVASILAQHGAQSPTRLTKAFDAMGKVVGPVGKATQTVYQFEEQLFKLAIMKHAMRRGKTAEEGVALAEKWLFDYGNVSPLVEDLRTQWWGIPFITWSYKMAPRMLELAADHPIKVMAALGTLTAISQGGIMPHVEDEDAPWWLRWTPEVAPGHMRPRFAGDVPAVNVGSEEAPNFLNVGKYFPTPFLQPSNPGDSGPIDFGLRTAGGVARTLGGPAMRMGAEFISNRHIDQQGARQEISDPNAPYATRGVDFLKHAGRELLPPLAPGGSAYDRLFASEPWREKALAEDPNDPTMQPQSPIMRALGAVGGMSTTGPMPEERLRKQFEQSVDEEIKRATYSIEQKIEKAQKRGDTTEASRLANRAEDIINQILAKYGLQ